MINDPSSELELLALFCQQLHHTGIQVTEVYSENEISIEYKQKDFTVYICYDPVEVPPFTDLVICWKKTGGFREPYIELANPKWLEMDFDVLFGIKTNTTNTDYQLKLFSLCLILYDKYSITGKLFPVEYMVDNGFDLTMLKEAKEILMLSDLVNVTRKGLVLGPLDKYSKHLYDIVELYCEREK